MLNFDLSKSFYIVIAEKDSFSGSRIGGLAPERTCSTNEIACKRCLKPLKYFLTLDLSETIPDIDKPMFSVYGCEEIDCLYDEKGTLTPPGVHIGIHNACPRQEAGSDNVEANFEGRKLKFSRLENRAGSRSKLFGSPDFLNDTPEALSKRLAEGYRFVFQFDEEDIIGKLNYKTAFFGFGTIYVLAKIDTNRAGIAFTNPQFYWESG